MASGLSTLSCRGSTRLEGTESCHEANADPERRAVAEVRPAWRVLKVQKEAKSVRGWTCCRGSTRLEGTERTNTRKRLSRDERLERVDPRGGYRKTRQGT